MESVNTEDLCCHRKANLCQNPQSNSVKRTRESMKNFVAYQSFAKIFSIDGKYVCGVCYTFWQKNNILELFLPLKYWKKLAVRSISKLLYKKL
jgi:hypothetical protein